MSFGSKMLVLTDLIRPLIILCTDAGLGAEPSVGPYGSGGHGFSSSFSLQSDASHIAHISLK